MGGFANVIEKFYDWFHKIFEILGITEDDDESKFVKKKNKGACGGKKDERDKTCGGNKKDLSDAIDYKSEYEYELGTWTDDKDIAASYARDHKSIIIGILYSSDGYESCQRYFDNEGDTEEFLNWAKENNIVLLKGDHVVGKDDPKSAYSFLNLCLNTPSPIAWPMLIMIDYDMTVFADFTALPGGLVSVSNSQAKVNDYWNYNTSEIFTNFVNTRWCTADLILRGCFSQRAYTKSRVIEFDDELITYSSHESFNKPIILGLSSRKQKEYVPYTYEKDGETITVDVLVIDQKFDQNYTVYNATDDKMDYMVGVTDLIDPDDKGKIYFYESIDDMEEPLNYYTKEFSLKDLAKSPVPLEIYSEYAHFKIKNTGNKQISFKLTTQKVKRPYKQLKIKYNPDWTEEQIDDFKQQIQDFEGYCPCQPRMEDGSTICICKEFKETPKTGKCLCGLYVKYDPKDEDEPVPNVDRET